MSFENSRRRACAEVHTAVRMEALERRALMSAAPTVRLTRPDVERVLAGAASQASATQVVAVVDRDGQILGIFAGNRARTAGVRDQTGRIDPLLSSVVKAVTRARTGAFFASRQDAFTTRTARFIVQDHFPQPVSNTPGGPLYGVQFSSLPGSDVYSGPAISGDPGGVPLFKQGEPVGGIGVAGDGHDVLARSDLDYDPKVSAPSDVFAGREESDADEQVALAGASRFMAPVKIRATQIFLDGLRLPFTADQPASGKPARTLEQLIADGAGTTLFATPAAVDGLPLTAAPYKPQNSARPRGSPGSPFPTATIGGITGELKNTSPRVSDFGIIQSDDTTTPDRHDRLTGRDVRIIIGQAVREALKVRAAIRLPIGVPARVHIAVVDRDGDILGVFRMDDGTNFSNDVAVQKARTAAFFSDNHHAFTTRAIGFLSQRFFPAGIEGGPGGPLFHLQNALSLSGDFGISNRGATLPLQPGRQNPLANGITIFPGGAPLYKNGRFVGAIGVSGDGVDQDDIISFAGTNGFGPKRAWRADELAESRIVSFVKSRLSMLRTWFNLDERLVDSADLLDRLDHGLDDVQLPYVKFPRNPDL
jgi:uncharacterized protein GlcG (DUF336 family)